MTAALRQQDDGADDRVFDEAEALIALAGLSFAKAAAAAVAQNDRLGIPTHGSPRSTPTNARLNFAANFHAHRRAISTLQPRLRSTTTSGGVSRPAVSRRCHDCDPRHPGLAPPGGDMPGVLFGRILPDEVARFDRRELRVRQALDKELGVGQRHDRVASVDMVGDLRRVGLLAWSFGEGAAASRRAAAILRNMACFPPHHPSASLPSVVARSSSPSRVWNPWANAAAIRRCASGACTFSRKIAESRR